MSAPNKSRPTKNNSSNILVNPLAPRHVQRFNIVKATNQFKKENEKEEKSGGNTRFIRRNEQNQNYQKIQDIQSTNDFKNKARNYESKHLYSFSPKEETAQNNQKGGILSDLISLGGISHGKSHNGNNSNASNSNSNSRRENEYNSALKIMEKMLKNNKDTLNGINRTINKFFVELKKENNGIKQTVNKLISELEKENKKTSKNNVDKLIEELKKENNKDIIDGINRTVNNFIVGLKIENDAFLASLNQLLCNYFKKK